MTALATRLTTIIALACTALPKAAVGILAGTLVTAILWPACLWVAGMLAVALLAHTSIRKDA